MRLVKAKIIKTFEFLSVLISILIFIFVTNMTAEAKIKGYQLKTYHDTVSIQDVSATGFLAVNEQRKDEKAETIFEANLEKNVSTHTDTSKSEIFEFLPNVMGMPPISSKTDGTYILEALNPYDAFALNFSKFTEKFRFDDGNIDKIEVDENNNRLYSRDSGKSSAEYMKILFPSSAGHLSEAGGSRDFARLSEDCKPTPEFVAKIAAFLHNNIRIDDSKKLKDKLDGYIKRLKSVKYVEYLVSEIEGVQELFEKIIKEQHKLEIFKSTSKKYMNESEFNILINGILYPTDVNELENLKQIRLMLRDLQSKENSGNLSEFEKMEWQFRKLNILNFFQVLKDCAGNSVDFLSLIKNKIEEINAQIQPFDGLMRESLKEKFDYFRALNGKKITALNKSKDFPKSYDEFCEKLADVKKNKETLIEAIRKKYPDFKEDAIDSLLSGNQIGICVEVKNFLKNELGLEWNSNNEISFEVDKRSTTTLLSLLKSACEMIDQEYTKKTYDEKEPQKVFPRYTAERMLVAYFIEKFESIDDLDKFYMEVQKRIILAKKANKEDYEEAVSHVENIKKCLKSTNFSENSPYTEFPIAQGGTLMISNVDANSMVSFGETQFLDCADVAARHVLNLLLYSYKGKDNWERVIHASEVNKYVEMANKISCAIANHERVEWKSLDERLKMFYAYQSKGNANSGDYTTRNLWCYVVSNMNSLKNVETGMYQIRYVKENCELETGIINQIKLFYNIAVVMNFGDKEAQIKAKEKIDNLAAKINSRKFKESEVEKLAREAYDLVIALINPDFYVTNLTRMEIEGSDVMCDLNLASAILKVSFDVHHELEHSLVRYNPVFQTAIDNAEFEKLGDKNQLVFLFTLYADSLLSTATFDRFYSNVLGYNFVNDSSEYYTKMKCLRFFRKIHEMEMDLTRVYNMQMESNITIDCLKYIQVKKGKKISRNLLIEYYCENFIQSSEQAKLFLNNICIGNVLSLPEKCGFKYETNKTDVIVYPYDLKSKICSIPSQFNGKKVTRIGKFAFFGMDWLETINFNLGDVRYSINKFKDEFVLDNIVVNLRNITYLRSLFSSIESIKINDLTIKIPKDKDKFSVIKDYYDFFKCAQNVTLLKDGADIESDGLFDGIAFGPNARIAHIKILNIDELDSLKKCVDYITWNVRPVDEDGWMSSRNMFCYVVDCLKDTLNYNENLSWANLTVEKIDELFKITLPKKYEKISLREYFYRVLKGKSLRNFLQGLACPGQFLDLPKFYELKYKKSGKGVTVYPCNFENEECVIPSEIEGSPITQIGEYAFYGVTGLKIIRFAFEGKEYIINKIENDFVLDEISVNSKSIDYLDSLVRSIPTLTIKRLTINRSKNYNKFELVKKCANIIARSKSTIMKLNGQEIDDWIVFENDGVINSIVVCNRDEFKSLAGFKNKFRAIKIVKLDFELNFPEDQKLANNVPNGCEKVIGKVVLDESYEKYDLIYYNRKFGYKLDFSNIVVFNCVDISLNNISFFKKFLLSSEGEGKTVRTLCVGKKVELRLKDKNTLILSEVKVDNINELNIMYKLLREIGNQLSINFLTIGFDLDISNMENFNAFLNLIKMVKVVCENVYVNFDGQFEKIDLIEEDGRTKISNIKISALPKKLDSSEVELLHNIRDHFYFDSKFKVEEIKSTMEQDCMRKIYGVLFLKLLRENADCFDSITYVGYNEQYLIKVAGDKMMALLEEVANKISK